MQCACAILSSLDCPALQTFSTLSHKRYDFGKKLLNTKCVFRVSSQLLSETFLILRRNERDVIENVYWSSCGVPFIIIAFVMKLELSRQIVEKYSNINFREKPSSESRVVPCGQDRQTYMTNLIDAFRNFANGIKNCVLQGHKHLNDRKKARSHTFPSRGRKVGVSFVVHVFVEKIKSFSFLK